MITIYLSTEGQKGLGLTLSKYNCKYWQIQGECLCLLEYVAGFTTEFKAHDLESLMGKVFPGAKDNGTMKRKYCTLEHAHKYEVYGHGIILGLLYYKQEELPF